MSWCNFKFSTCTDTAKRKTLCHLARSYWTVSWICIVKLIDCISYYLINTVVLKYLPRRRRRSSWRNSCQSCCAISYLLHHEVVEIDCLLGITAPHAHCFLPSNFHWYSRWNLPGWGSNYLNVSWAVRVDAATLHQSAGCYRTVCWVWVLEERCPIADYCACWVETENFRVRDCWALWRESCWATYTLRHCDVLSLNLTTSWILTLYAKQFIPSCCDTGVCCDGKWTCSCDLEVSGGVSCWAVRVHQWTWRNRAVCCIWVGEERSPVSQILWSSWLVRILRWKRWWVVWKGT